MAEPEDVVRASIRAFDDADWEALEALWDPDGVIVAPHAWPEGEERSGWPEICAQFQRIKADWAEDHMIVEELGEVRPGVLLTRLRWTVTGAASGVPLEVLLWMVATVRDGRYVRAEYFQEEEPARAVAEGRP